MIVFFDIEASSLGADSYPIEVGWASVMTEGEIRKAAMLIKPAPNWTDWSHEAERVHGIPRTALHAGRSLSYVARVLNERFAGETLFSDAPAQDSWWIDRLYQEAGTIRHWKLEDADKALGLMLRTREDRTYLNLILESSRKHRADEDAFLLARAYLELRSRQLSREPAPCSPVAQSSNADLGR